jgi:hypothetical protein
MIASFATRFAFEYTFRDLASLDMLPPFLQADAILKRRDAAPSASEPQGIAPEDAEESKGNLRFSRKRKVHPEEDTGSDASDTLSLPAPSSQTASSSSSSASSSSSSSSSSHPAKKYKVVSGGAQPKSKKLKAKKQLQDAHMKEKIDREAAVALTRFQLVKQLGSKFARPSSAASSSSSSAAKAERMSSFFNIVISQTSFDGVLLCSFGVFI